MKQGYSLQVIDGLVGSQLREDFELVDGRLTTRCVDIQQVTSAIVDLQERPSWCPSISIFQIKHTIPESESVWVCSEIIFTNNVFLAEFERFLRENMVEVPAKGFEDVPDEYLHYFKTPFALIPVDITKTNNIISPEGGNTYLGGTRKPINCQYKFEGVDFKSSATLRMIHPGILYNKLAEIEKVGQFKVVIKKMLKEKTNLESVEAFEYRRGSENVTVNHFVFRRKKAVR